MRRTTKHSFVTSNADVTDELDNWASTREQIGRQLKTFYERCMTDELPPRLREVLKKLDEDQPSTAQPPLIREIEN
jgi:predicted metal-dependent hydrolase